MRTKSRTVNILSALLFANPKKTTDAIDDETTLNIPSLNAIYYILLLAQKLTNTPPKKYKKKCVTPHGRKARYTKAIILILPHLTLSGGNISSLPEHPQLRARAQTFYRT